MMNEPGAPEPGRGRPRSDPRLTLYILKQVEQAVRAQLDDAVKPVGLTAVQYTALAALTYREGLSSAQLARRSFVSAQAMNQTVFTLERHGLIERIADTDNRRILRISLTARGRAALESCARDVAGVERRMLATLSDPEVAQLRLALDACHRALSKSPKAVHRTPPQPDG